MEMKPSSSLALRDNAQAKQLRPCMSGSMGDRHLVKDERRNNYKCTVVEDQIPRHNYACLRDTVARGANKCRNVREIVWR